MEPSSSAAAAGGASVELAVDLHVAPHAHMPPKQQHLLSTARLAANNSAWRLLGARPRTSHLSSARTCWQVPGRGGKRPFLPPSFWRGHRSHRCECIAMVSGGRCSVWPVRGGFLRRTSSSSRAAFFSFCATPISRRLRAPCDRTKVALTCGRFVHCLGA